MEIRVLARQGMSIRAIAQQLRVSRNTVRQVSAQPGLPKSIPAGCSDHRNRSRKLSPRSVSRAKPHWIPATVLLRELRGAWLHWQALPSSRPQFISSAPWRLWHCRPF